MRKVFLSFADKNMHRALHRINIQASKMNYYDFILTLDESSLNIKFSEEFRDVFKRGSRGFGFWCWKPQIILQTLDQMDDGDILQYTDAGCSLNVDGKDRLNDYFQLAKISETGILAFQAKPPSFHNPSIRLPDLTEEKWCKGDLCDFFGVRNNDTIMKSSAIGAGIIFIRKCDASKRIINEWINVFRSDFSLLDDTTSRSINPPGFLDHRHDQSIFSILCKINSVATVSAYEYWYPSAYVSKLPDWKKLSKYPIHVKRDKGIHPLLKPYHFLTRVIKRITFEVRTRKKND
jgi:hypothetical protein